MRKGDLITIAHSPWNERSLFGYKNGDLGMILEIFPYPNQISLPSIRVFIFASEKIVTIPILYIERIGE